MPKLAHVVACLIAMLGCAVCAHAACPSPDSVNEFVRKWNGFEQWRGYEQALTIADGYCAQARFIAQLERTHGRIVGYKAALTNEALQARFGVNEPVRGTLLEKMLLRDGVVVPARFAIRPIFEADLLVEIADDGINSATTHIAALRSIAHLSPFIELADLVVAEGVAITGPTIAAINAGARLGVVGASMRTEATNSFASALARMQVVVMDGSGAEIARAPGTAILGHPLDAVLWLVQDLNRSGIKLKKGDLLSLGSFSPPLVPRAGSRIEVRYEGLPGSPSVSVTFE